MTKAVYAFSGDPITFGHVNIVKRAAKIFDTLIVAIGVNPDKKYLFSLEERTIMAKKSLSMFSNVSVCSFQGLLTDFAYEQGVDVIVKGVRSNTDFAYEKSLDKIGDSQKLGIDTVFLFADANLEHISSSAVKALQKEQGLTHEYVPLYVKQKLEEKISGQYIIGVTGEIGVGKSYICQKLVDIGKEKGVEVHNIELDNIGHDILEKLQEPKYKEVRQTIIDAFGEGVSHKNREENSVINRKALGEIVFSDKKKLEQLNKIMSQPILVRLRRMLYGKKGILLLNAALIMESDMSYLCNNNVVLVKAKRSLQKKRLEERGLTTKQIETRISSQYDYFHKKKLLEDHIEKTNQGAIWDIISSNDSNLEIERLFDIISSQFSRK